jgi:hypothetical protein
MRWFNKGKPKELWDEVVDWPIDDLEAARRIRDICNSAFRSAEIVGSQVGGPVSNANKYETERYKRAAKAAMETAIKISDDLLRDAALRQTLSDEAAKFAEAKSSGQPSDGLMLVYLDELDGDAADEEPDR